MFKFFSHGILGMNARNLKYIKTKNSRESISLADSKLKTKHFLSSRGIPFAETYITLSTQQELQDFSLDTLGVDAFVIKPNK
jgi:glutathione synthase/RimK-type ligase-like ATP-grasp enzyme